MARTESLTDIRNQSHRSHESESPDVSVREGFVQADGGGKDRAAFGDDVVYKDHARWREWKSRNGPLTGDRKRLIVLVDSGTIGIQGCRGFSDREAPFEGRPQGAAQSNTL